MRFASRQIASKRLVDLVPAVNVVLLLTFFFLLSWSFVLQPGVEVRLPTTSLPLTTQQGRHVVTLKPVSKDEVLIFFDDDSLDIEHLRVRLKHAAEDSPGEWITINADDSVAHGRVQQVASMAMEQGLHVTLAMQRNVPGSLTP